MDLLATSLLDLLHEIGDQHLPLTVGGGFGLFLKRREAALVGWRTLFSELPEARATNDIDLFLRAELLADRRRVEALVGAIKRLGFRPVEEAKFLQWRRSFSVSGVAREVKLDALVGPLGVHRGKLKVHSPRIRPRGGSLQFHAHATEEALFIDEQPIPIALSGTLSSGDSHSAIVHVPEAFPYLLMKLTAFADRKNDAREDFGRHHVIDAYALAGLMTEGEFERALLLARRAANNEHYQRARAIVRDEFSSSVSLGTLRLREHPLFRPALRVADFLSVLREIFPPA